MFHHFLEEGFPIPMGEHRARRNIQSALVVRNQNGGLMAAFIQLTQLPHPKPDVEPGAVFRKKSCVGSAFGCRNDRKEKSFYVHCPAGCLS